MMRIVTKSIHIIFTAIVFCALARAERIKDIATIEGVRTNQLVGYGLVVGLDGSGDQAGQAPFTNQSFQSMLNQFGVRMPASSNSQLKNVAAVAISAELPPFVKQGQTIDITVSSIGNAKSLRGGILLMSPLKGADGQVYAIAQGSVVVSGIGASGSDGSKITVNIPSVGRIPGGATVEREVTAPFIKDGVITLNLNRPDFTTAQRMADAINAKMNKKIAYPLDASSIRVSVNRGGHAEKSSYVGQPINFISELENITLESGDAAAKIIVNARTGTIVINQNVIVTPAAVSHGSLTVMVSEDLSVSQPAPLSNGQTTPVPSSEVKIVEDKKRAFIFGPTTSLQEIVKAINKVGAAPGDLVAILEALKAAGALDAQLEII